MLFECLDVWVPPVFRQGELALSSIQRRVDSVFERTLGPVILQPILSVQLMLDSIVHISVAACDRFLLLCDGKPQLRHVLRLQKKDINKYYKNI